MSRGVYVKKPTHISCMQVTHESMSYVYAQICMHTCMYAVNDSPGQSKCGKMAMVVFPSVNASNVHKQLRVQATESHMHVRTNMHVQTGIHVFACTCLVASNAATKTTTGAVCISIICLPLAVQEGSVHIVFTCKFRAGNSKMCCRRDLLSQRDYFVT